MSLEYLDDDDSNTTIKSVDYIGTFGKWKLLSDNEGEEEDASTFGSDMETDLFGSDVDSNSTIYSALKLRGNL